MPWARVTIDGRFRGETPLQRLRLRARVYTVRRTNPARRLSRTERVRVTAGRTTSRVFRLATDPAPRTE